MSTFTPACNLDILLARLNNAELQMQKQQQQLTDLRVQYHRQQNQQTRIAKLPLDVLVEIWRFSQSPTPLGALPFEIKASHVSSRWRDTALSVPSLWKTIKLCIKSPPFLNSNDSDRPLWWKGSQILELYLERSAACVLDVDLVLKGTWDDCLKALAPHAGRWRTLSLLSEETYPSPACRQILRELHTPQLESFTLQVDFCMRPLSSADYGDPPPLAIPTIFAGGAPCLSKVHIPVAPLPSWYPPLQFVTIFKSTSWDDVVDNSCLRAALASMPLLTHLTLAVEHVREGSLHTTPQPSSIMLRHLKTARLILQPGLRWLLRNIRAPKLKHVELNGMQVNSGGCHSIFPSVRTLIIDDATQDSIPISKDILTAFPNIRHLLITEYPASTAPECPLLGFSMGPTENTLGAIPWPHLLTLQLSAVKGNVFTQGMRERKEAGGTLKTIILPCGTSSQYPNEYQALSEIADVVESEPNDVDEGDSDEEEDSDEEQAVDFED